MLFISIPLSLLAFYGTALAFTGTMVAADEATLNLTWPRRFSLIAGCSVLSVALMNKLGPDAAVIYFLAIFEILYWVWGLPKRYLYPTLAISTLIALFAANIHWSVVAMPSEQKLCGTVIRLVGADLKSGSWIAVVSDKHVVHVPEHRAYDRLAVGKMFTFIYRQGTLIAISDGNLCTK